MVSTVNTTANFTHYANLETSIGFSEKITKNLYNYGTGNGMGMVGIGTPYTVLNPSLGMLESI